MWFNAKVNGSGISVVLMAFQGNFLNKTNKKFVSMTSFSDFLHVWAHYL